MLANLIASPLVVALPAMISTARAPNGQFPDAPPLEIPPLTWLNLKACVLTGPNLPGAWRPLMQTALAVRDVWMIVD